MNKIFNKNKKEGGYAMLELLFYIAFFCTLSLVVISAMITMAKSFKETSLQSEFVQSGSIMEKISREVRQAYDVNVVNAGDIILSQKDTNGVNKTIEFTLVGNDLLYKENGTLTGNLNTPNIDVTSLLFTKINTTKGKAVKIFLTISSVNDISNRSQNFYDTVVLRGSY